MRTIACSTLIGLASFDAAAKTAPPPPSNRISPSKLNKALTRQMPRWRPVPPPSEQEVPSGSGLERWVEWAGFSFPINLSQQPAISVPCGSTLSGLPIILQIIGARGADSRVLALASAFAACFPACFL